MKMNDIKIILELRKEKKFDKIYELYGRDVYLKSTPLSYRNVGADKLIKDGRYFDLYEKHGEDIYKIYMKKIQKADVQNELGIGFHFVNFLFFEECKRKLKLLRNMAFGFAFGTVVMGKACCLIADDIIEDNSAIYENEIDDYNKEIDEYAEYINGLGLNDLEIIIKVMNDMWSTIDGYNNPGKYDVRGYERLSLYMDGYGVCRHMADDFTARMNAINPEYEACNLIVYLNEVEINHINRNILVQNATVDPEYEVDEMDVLFNDMKTNVMGNHMVSCITLKNENIILVVDPTNPSIGVLKDGQIYMLSDKVIDGIALKPLGHIIYGVDSVNNYTNKILESYTTSGDINALKQKYGIDSQNDTLEEVISNYDTDNYGIKY